MTERHYTVTELRRVLGISRVAIYRWVHKGRIQAIHDGERTLIPASSVSNLVQSWAEEGERLIEASREAALKLQAAQRE